MKKESISNRANKIIKQQPEASFQASILNLLSEYYFQENMPFFVINVLTTSFLSCIIIAQMYTPIV